jgi:hypothetical protein
MKLFPLIFLSGILSNLQIANALSSSDTRIQKRAVDIPALMDSDGMSLKVYAYDADAVSKVESDLKAISHDSDPRADFSLDKTFPSLQEFETSLGSPTKKHMILLATPKGSNKVLGFFNFDLGVHAPEELGRNNALLGLKWVHQDYRGIVEGKGLLGNQRGIPYNVNMAITEAGMQTM